MTASLAVAVLFLAACGGDEPAVDAASTVDAAAGGDAATTVDAMPVAFALTSPAFIEGGVIPVAHACAGANTSPALAWTSGPPGTLG